MLSAPLVGPRARAPWALGPSRLGVQGYGFGGGPPALALATVAQLLLAAALGSLGEG
jgi:hypothetical protein